MLRKVYIINVKIDLEIQDLEAIWIEVANTHKHI